MSFLTGTNTELIYASTAAGTAKASFTSEVQINDTAGMGAQAFLPPNFWAIGASKQQAIGRGFHVKASGILSSTGTPNYTFTIRLGAAASTSTAIVLGSAALATNSGVSNAYWELWGDVILESLGAAGTNSTVRGTGLCICGSISTGSGMNSMYGGAASPGTVATVDTTITNYINFNVTCSANSASNTITLQQLLLSGLN